ncbi:SixA phosphatase family protein [Robiginitalea sp.]|jgi:phosphohistidine phosphatase|uniref:SixA phosphatase family protein n=1 Tax=Robiginitalea sp. TaxID=1902411 RepID=UPI003C7931B6
MKELILVRHAKSSWEYDVKDADRPLGERGIADAHLIAQALEENLKGVQAIFSSPANRALHTCMILMREMGLPLGSLQVVRELYDFSGEGVRAHVRSLEDSLEKVMLFGHNNAMTHIANKWGSKYLENVPTCGVVHLSFKVNTWKDISYGDTLYTVFPKNLR